MEANSKGSAMHVTGMLYVNVNCSDYERSYSFYELLGLQVIWEVP